MDDILYSARRGSRHREAVNLDSRQMGTAPRCMDFDEDFDDAADGLRFGEDASFGDTWDPLAAPLTYGRNDPLSGTEDCGEDSGFTPTVQPFCHTLSTGPFVMPRGGKLILRLEDPYPLDVRADVRVYDLRRNPRRLLCGGGNSFRKALRLRPFQTRTVYFDTAIPAGMLLDVAILCDGLLLPSLQLDPLNGIAQALFKSTEFMDIRPCPCGP